MIGVLNDTCKWCKQLNKNKYGEVDYSEPIILPCAISKDVRLVQTDLGLIKQEEKYYILHFAEVQDGDTIDDKIVSVGCIKDFRGQVLYYKAVVLNG